jgi:hypothetical protein
MSQYSSGTNLKRMKRYLVWTKSVQPFRHCQGARHTYIQTEYQNYFFIFSKQKICLSIKTQYSVLNKFWEELVAYLPLVWHGRHRKRRLQQFFIAAGTCLLSRCLVHTDWCKGFMTYAVETDSGAMIPSFRCSKVNIWGFTGTQTAWRSHKPTLGKEAKENEVSHPCFKDEMNPREFKPVFPKSDLTVSLLVLHKWGCVKPEYPSDACWNIFQLMRTWRCYTVASGRRWNDTPREHLITTSSSCIHAFIIYAHTSHSNTGRARDLSRTWRLFVRARNVP